MNEIEDEVEEWITVSTKIRTEVSEDFKRLCMLRDTTVSKMIAEFIQREVVDLQQTALFKIWRGHTPASPEIVIQAVADNVAKRALRLDLGLELQFRIFRVASERKIERVEYLLCKHVMRESRRPSYRAGLQKGRSQEADFDEVVKVARLE